MNHAFGWSPQDDNELKEGVYTYGLFDWKAVAASMSSSKTDAQCFHRYEKVVQPRICRGHWTKNEDSIMRHIVKQTGPRQWTTVAKYLPGRTGKQCRERWKNHLAPDIHKGPWSKEEDTILLEQRSKVGNKWSHIARRLPGRTENAIKNRWNSYWKRRFKQFTPSGDVFDTQFKDKMSLGVLLGQDTKDRAPISTQKVASHSIRDLLI